MTSITDLYAERLAERAAQDQQFAPERGIPCMDLNCSCRSFDADRGDRTCRCGHDLSQHSRDEFEKRRDKEGETHGWDDRISIGTLILGWTLPIATSFLLWAGCVAANQYTSDLLLGLVDRLGLRSSFGKLVKIAPSQSNIAAAPTWRNFPLAEGPFWPFFTRSLLLTSVPIYIFHSTAGTKVHISTLFQQDKYPPVLWYAGLSCLSAANTNMNKSEHFDALSWSVPARCVAVSYIFILNTDTYSRARWLHMTGVIVLGILSVCSSSTKMPFKHAVALTSFQATLAILYKLLASLAQRVTFNNRDVREIHWWMKPLIQFSIATETVLLSTTL